MYFLFEASGLSLSEMPQSIFRGINIYFCSHTPLHDCRYNFAMALTSCKPATLLKVTLLHGCFSRFLNCTNAKKPDKTCFALFI